MKVLIRNIFFFFIPIVLIIQIGINFFDMDFFSKEYYQRVFAKRVALGEIKVEPSPEVLFVGDSRLVAGVIPKKLKQPSVNIAVGAGLPVDAFYLVSNYLKQEPRTLKTCVISFVPSHFDYSEFFLTRSVSFKFMPLGELLEIEKEMTKRGFYFNKVSSISFINRLSFYLEIVSIKLGLHALYQNFIKNRVFVPFRNNKPIYSKIVESKGHTFYGMADGVDQSALENVTKPIVSTLGEYYFEKLVALLIENNIKPVFINSPVSKITSESKNFTSYYDSIFSFLRKVKKKHQKFEFREDIPVYGNEYFGDPSHLNLKGAIKWTSELSE